jgi:tight adherence protein B
MSSFGLILIGVAFMMIGAGLYLIDKSMRDAATAQTLGRLEDAMRVKKKFELADNDPLKKKYLPRFFTDTLISAGLKTDNRTLVLLAAGLILPAVILSLLQGVLALFGALMLEALLLVGWLLMRQRARRKRIIEQLPGFIDAVSRISAVGYSLNIAFNSAVDMAEQPLKASLSVTLDMQQAGLELDQSMSRIAAIYGLTEFRLMSSIIALAMNYGGKSDILLSRLGQYLRDRDQHYKEMLAMSSEARMSAVILAGLTPFVVGVMLVISPGYLISMWNDESGATMLIAATSLQLLGMYLMMRMVKNF